MSQSRDTSLLSSSSFVGALSGLVEATFEDASFDIPPPDFESALHRYVNNLASIHATELESAYPNDPDFRELNDGELVLNYFVGRSRLLILARDKAGLVDLLVLDIGADALEELVHGFRADLIAGKHAGEAGRELSRILLGDIALDDYNRLLIWPDSVLAVLPFQALVRGDSFLVEEHVIEYLSGFGARDTGRPSDAVSALIVADPGGDLPGALAEASRIEAQLANSQTLRGSEATLERVRDQLGDVSLLHIAAHARGNVTSPNFAFVEFGPRERLYALDIGHLDVTGKRIFLSACETSIAQHLPGDDVYGISNAFLAAGALAVMGTLWRVEDDSVAIFADRFYYHHRSGADWPEASALAARDFISGNEWLVQGGEVQMLTDPFYWAGFNAIRPALQ